MMKEILIPVVVGVLFGAFFSYVITGTVYESRICDLKGGTFVAHVCLDAKTK